MTLIVIDPGHSIDTAGKRSPDGTLREYEFNRDVAKRLSKYLEAHGIKTKITCPTDKGLASTDSKDLQKRVELANSLKADYFISIHANAYGNDWNSANGWEIYPYQLKGKGYELAKCIQKHSIPYLGIKNRGIKKGSGFYVVKNTKMTAVLIEHGFYTNKKECALLKSDDFREKCAIADAKGILEFLGIKWEEPVQGKNIYVNGKDTGYEYIEKNGRLYIPVKEISSSLGCKCTTDFKGLKITMK